MSSALRTIQNKEKALTDMMDEYGDSLLRMCCLYLKDRSLAEDAVQETFLKAYLGMDGFRGDAQELTWLMRIAFNVCSDMLRKPWHKWVDRYKTPESVGRAQDLTLRDDTVSSAVMGLRKKLPSGCFNAILSRAFGKRNCRDHGRAAFHHIDLAGTVTQNAPRHAERVVL